MFQVYRLPPETITQKLLFRIKRGVLGLGPYFFILAGEKILRPSHFVKYRRLNFFIFEIFLLFPVLCALLHMEIFLYVQSSYISYTKICYKIFRSKTGKIKKIRKSHFFNCVFWENKHLDFAIISRQGSTDRKQRRNQFLDFEIQNFMTKMIHQKHIIS